VDNARLFAEVHAADRRKDEFLAVLGHELRNPLAPIRTAVALLRDPAGGNAAYAHGLIDRQVDHLTRLVDDLLDVSRLAQGKLRLEAQRVELAGVVAPRGRDVPAAGRSAAARIDGGAGRRRRRGWTPTRCGWAQVFANLLTNAAKYTPAGGHVPPGGGGGAGGQAVVRVRDDGLGIAPDMLPKVFDLYIQSERGAGRTPRAGWASA